MLEGRLRVLDLFSGIGGFSLGLERAGFETVAFCEIDPYCQKVLRKHWPHVPIHDDIKTLRGDEYGPVDVVCGGFPCQDLSVAGRQAGIEAERSGLWSEYARIIGAVRPRFAIVENVTNLLSGPSEWRGRWFGRVLGDLAEIGYDAEWHCIPAAAVGAPHIRERVWVIAYSHEIGRDRTGRYLERQNVICDRCQWTAAPFDGWRNVVNWLKSPDASHIWEVTDRETGRMDDGVRRGLDRADIGGLGNAVVPQIPEMIGRAIAEAEKERPPGPKS